MAAGEGQQFMAHISKRLRALRKRYNRITGLEESISEGQTLNKDQQEFLGSKPVVTALIQELEKLRLLLPPPPAPSAAVSEEISLAVQNNQQQKARNDEEDATAKTDCKISDGLNADEEEVTAKTDCTISDGLNAGEVSKDDTSSAPCSGSSEGVTTSPTSEEVEEMEWTEVKRRSKPRGRGDLGKKTYNRQSKRPN